MVYMLVCPKCIFLPMLLNNLSVTALTWSSGPCHLSQVQLWIRVHVYSISSVLLLSCVVFFATPLTAALQTSLSINIWSLPRLKSIESMMLSNNPILCCPLLLPSFLFRIMVFSSESVIRITYPKYWSFSFRISPSNEYAAEIYFRIDWFDLLAVQNPLKSPAHQFKL